MLYTVSVLGIEFIYFFNNKMKIELDSPSVYLKHLMYDLVIL